jgi:DNA polymerase III psi subunit
MEARMPPTRITTRQQAYLDAMDIGVWRLRESDTVATPDTAHVPRLKLGPGSGGILLICAEDTDTASRLANDINRTLGSVPVWAWPHADTGGVELSNAVEENLFTMVAIFGHDLAMQFFDGELPVSLNSAKMVLLPEMKDILGQAEARRVLWDTFCRSGMVRVHDHNA